MENQKSLSQKVNLKLLGFPRRYLNVSLQDFKSFQETSGVYNRIQDYLKNEEFKKGIGFYFWGSNGVGKTRLSLALLKELLNKNPMGKGIFYRTKTFLNDLKATIEEPKKFSYSTYDLLELVTFADFLVLDDFGEGNYSSWEIEKISHVVCERYNSMLTTFFTSNYPIRKNKETKNTIEDKLGKNISSRLLEMSEVIEIKGEDMRLSAFKT